MTAVPTTPWAATRRWRLLQTTARAWGLGEPPGPPQPLAPRSAPWAAPLLLAY